MHLIHSALHLPRDFRMSPGVDTALQEPICFSPGVIASGFWVSSDVRFGSSLGRMPALSVAFLSLLDMARVFLG